MELEFSKIMIAPFIMVNLSMGYRMVKVCSLIPVGLCTGVNGKQAGETEKVCSILVMAPLFLESLKMDGRHAGNVTGVMERLQTLTRMRMVIGLIMRNEPDAGVL